MLCSVQGLFMLLDCYGFFHDTVIDSGCLVLIARFSELSIETHMGKGDCDQFCSIISAFFLRNLEKKTKTKKSLLAAPKQ